MKPYSFLAGLAIGLLASVAFIVTNRQTERATVPLDQLHEAAWLQRELDLDEAQVRQFAELEKTYAADVTDCCANHCGARKRMGEAVFGPEAPARLEALLAEMSRAQTQSDLATIRHIQAVHALLRPDQRARYERLVTRCVCADCPMCSEHKEET